jgi:MFS family permease
VRIDWAGAVLLSGALVCLLIGVTRANTWGWGSARTIGLLGAGVALGALWLWVESRLSEPLIELRVLRTRAVAVTNVAGVLVGFSMFTSFLLIPQFAQTGEEAGYGFGFSVLESGLLMAPSSVTQLVAGPVAGRLGVKVGFRTTLALGTALSTVCFLLLVLEHDHAWQFVLAGMFLGAGITFSFSSMANLIVGAVDQRDVGIATGINTITRTVGGAFGAAVSAAILASDTLDGSIVPTEHAYTLAFTLSALAGILALLVSFAIPRPPRPPEALVGAPAAAAPTAAAPGPGRA